MDIYIKNLSSKSDDPTGQLPHLVDQVCQRIIEIAETETVRNIWMLRLLLKNMFIFPPSTIPPGTAHTAYRRSGSEI